MAKNGNLRVGHGTGGAACQAGDGAAQRPFKRTLPRHDQNFEDIFYNQCMTSAMSEYLFRFEAIKVEKNMAVKGKGQKPKNEVKSKKYQTFRGDMLQLKESRAILLH